jgi:transposase
VWFQYAARFGQQGTMARGWAPTGSRPRALRQLRYDYLYVLGAVCPGTGQSVGLLSPELNTGVVNIYLQQFSRELGEGVHAVVIWDQAGYHTTGRLEVPANVSLIELPPRAPELNPVENLWHYLRDHHWANRAYADYNALLEAASDAWQQACLHPEIIRSVCRAPYLECQN